MQKSFVNKTGICPYLKGICMFLECLCSSDYIMKLKKGPRGLCPGPKKILLSPEKQ
jgi:hypothetical protein